MQHPLLIDCETLQTRLGQPGLVILDVRGRSTYEFGGHIPGENVVELDPESKRYLRTLADNLGSVRK